MIAIRPALFVLASVGVVVGVLSTEWSKVTRETTFDGFSQKEHLILGRFKRTSELVSPKINASRPLAQKFKEYNLSPVEGEGMATITTEGPRSEYSYSKDGDYDLVKESKKIRKSYPWMTLTWHGKRFTSFVAQGFHPTHKGHVSIYVGKLPEGKYGIGKAHVLTSIRE